MKRLAHKFIQLVLRITKKVYLRYKRLLPDMPYHLWATHNENECFVSENQHNNGPLISIVVPTFNTPVEHLRSMVYSVINQHYDNWELLLINASDSEDSVEAVRQCARIDSRITIIEPGENLGISWNTNEGIKKTQGTFVAFLDHDDILHPCALHSVSEKINSKHPDIIYTDEDKITDSGVRYFEPHCKPQWSPHLLRNVNYINHLCVIRTDFINKVGGLRQQFDGAQDYDLLLRVIDQCKPKVEHIPHVLYHWRAAKSSTAHSIMTKSYIFEAGTHALQEHLTRNQKEGRVKAIKNRPGFYEIMYKPPHKTTLVVLPVSVNRRRFCADWLKMLLTVLKEDKQHTTQLIIGEWYKEYSQSQNQDNITYLFDAHPKEYWQEAAKAVESPVVLCFQEAVLPSSGKAISKLAGVVSQNGGIVSPIVVGADNVILDAGLVDTDYGLERLFCGYEFGESTYFGSTEWTRDVATATLSVFATSKQDFQQLVSSNSVSRRISRSALAELSTTFVTWAHTPFTYQGLLSFETTPGKFFNSQLSQATYKIAMKASAWEGYNERSSKD